MPSSFQVSTNYAIRPAYLDISVLQQWVKKRSVDSCPPAKPDFIWSDNHGGTPRESFVLFYPATSCEKNHPRRLRGGEHSLPIQVFYISMRFRFLFDFGQQEASFVQLVVMTKCKIDRTTQLTSLANK